MQRPQNQSLGEYAYISYVEAIGWRDQNGQPLPQYRHLPEEERRAWSRTAQAIRDDTLRKVTRVVEADTEARNG